MKLTTSILTLVLCTQALAKEYTYHITPRIFGGRGAFEGWGGNGHLGPLSNGPNSPASVWMKTDNLGNINADNLTDWRFWFGGSGTQTAAANWNPTLSTPELIGDDLCRLHANKQELSVFCAPGHDGGLRFTTDLGYADVSFQWAIEEGWQTMSFLQDDVLQYTDDIEPGYRMTIGTYVPEPKKIVPEPAGWLLLGLGAIGLLRGRSGSAAATSNPASFQTCR